MKKFKRNQVEQAIFQALRAEGARIYELRFRLKRLLAADRTLAGSGSHVTTASANMRFIAPSVQDRE